MSDDYADYKVCGEVDAFVTNFPDSVISRRDYFAAAALQGLLASGINSDPNQARTAARAVEYADALIAILDEGQPSD